MWFNFVTANHGSLAALDRLKSITDYMRGVLSVCGHETTISFNDLDPNAINVFFEYFQDQTMINQILNLKNKGFRIGIVATELIINNNIPYGRNGIVYANNNANNEILNLSRIAGFNTLAKEVDFIWAFLEQTAHDYRVRTKFCEYFPVGHIPGVMTQRYKAPKDIDVLLFGKSTPHRDLVIQKIKNDGVNVTCIGDGYRLGFIPENLLNSFLDRTKIGLNLTLHSERDTVNNIDPRFVSCMRVKELFDRNICVVSEDIPLNNPYKDFMVSVPIDMLGKVCYDILAKNTWATLGFRHAQGFSSDMDVIKLCSPIIQRTIESFES